MSENEIAVDAIEVVETGVFKTEHIFQTPTHVFGNLVLKAGKSSGTFTGVDETVLDFLKTGFWKPHYELRQRSAVLGSTAPRRGFTRALDIIFDGNMYGLFPRRSKFRSWVIKNHQDQILCEVSPRGAFKRGGIIKIISPIPFNLLVFTYCLVVKRWQEQSSAA